MIAEVSELASHLVSKWKKIVKAGNSTIKAPAANAAVGAIRRTSSESSTTSKAEFSKTLATAAAKSKPQQHPQTEIGILDKLQSEMSVDPLSGAKKQQGADEKKDAFLIPAPTTTAVVKKERPKSTVKAKISKPRSIGEYSHSEIIKLVRRPEISARKLQVLLFWGYKKFYYFYTAGHFEIE